MKLCLACTIGECLLTEDDDHRVNTEWQWRFLGKFRHDGKSALADEGGGARPLPLLYLPPCTKLQYTLQL
jgi:hypothetical protein